MNRDEIKRGGIYPKPNTTPEPKWHVMVDNLLDTIEDLHEGMGEIVFKEIKQMYGYPYDWTCKR